LLNFQLNNYKILQKSKILNFPANVKIRVSGYLFIHNIKKKFSFNIVFTLAGKLRI